MNTLKFIHAADLHLDSEFTSLSPEAAEKRREGQRMLLPRLADAVLKNGAQALVLSGDIFEKDAVSAETGRAFCRALGMLDAPVFICAGNHDPYFPGCVWDRLALPENVHLFKNENISCAEYPELNARFWGAGFEKEFCPPLLRDFTAPEKIGGVFDVMALHGDLDAGKSDYCPLTREELSKSGMDYVALGHIHMRSALSFAGETAWAYPGCPEGRGYDELGEKGCCLVTLSEKSAQAAFIPLGGAVYDIVKVDISGQSPAVAIENAAAAYSERDYLRIILTGKTETAIDLAGLRRELRLKLSELQLRDETVQKRDTWAALGRDDLEGLFLEKLKAMLDAASTRQERETIELAARFGVDALDTGGGRLF